MTETDKTRLIAELRAVQALKGLEDEAFVWLAQHGEELALPANEIYAREGEPADCLIILLKGELVARADEAGNDGASDGASPARSSSTASSSMCWYNSTPTSLTCPDCSSPRRLPIGRTNSIVSCHVL